MRLSSGCWMHRVSEAPAVGELRPVQHRNGAAEGLTCIHPRIHCAATPDTQPEYSETDLIIVNNFLNTLAEVAMAVASRNARDDEQA